MPAKSSSPEVSAASLVVGSSTTTTMRRSRPGGPPSSAGKLESAAKHPAAVRFVSHEPERTVADRRLVPGGGAQPFGSDACRIGAPGRIARSVRTSGKRSCGAENLITRVESSGASTEPHSESSANLRIAGGGLESGLEGPGSVASRRRAAVVPFHAGADLQGQRAAISTPAPVPGEVRLGSQGTVVAGKRSEQHVALHLAGEWMGGEERVDALEIGAGGEHHRRAPAVRRGLTGAEKDHRRDGGRREPKHGVR